MTSRPVLVYTKAMTATPQDAALLAFARKLTRPDEAEDLLQTALLIAFEAGREDLSQSQNRRWLAGVMRKQAALAARGALRRRRREAQADTTPDAPPDQPSAAALDLARSLPRRLRSTALLVLNGHSKAEILWLLGISDATLRQRFAQIRRHWQAADLPPLRVAPGLSGPLAYGRIRQALLGRPQGPDLRTHDPDGHLLGISSQNPALRQHRVSQHRKDT